MIELLAKIREPLGSLLCPFGLHRAPLAPVWNNGFLFGSCPGCARALIRRPQRKWKPVPRGFKVVWKPRPRGHPVWTAEVAGGGSSRGGNRRTLDDLVRRDTP